MSGLKDRSCITCKKGDPALTAQRATKLLRDIPDWASFRDVSRALQAAGLQLALLATPTGPASPAPPPERRRGPRKH